MNLLGRAVLVAVPTLLLAACGDATSSPTGADDGSTPPSPSHTSSPSLTPTATPTATPSQDRPGALTLEGLSQGAPPAVPYLRADADAPAGWVLVTPDGGERPLPRAYDAFAPMGNGLVGTASVEDQTAAFVLDGNLREVSRAAAPSGLLAVTPDGSIVGWFAADGRPHVVEAGGGREYDLPEVKGGDHLASLLSDGTTCKEGGGGNGCAAFVNSADGKKAWSAVSHGLVDEVPGVISVGDVATGGRMVAMTSIGDEGSCWGMFEVWEPKAMWKTCDYTLFDFSPSGERILAGPAYLDGFGQGIASVLDGEGDVLAEWHSRGHAAILHTVWEDDDHVLAIVFEEEQWAVLRLDITDGSAQVAVPPVPDQGGQGPFVLPTR